MFLSLTRLLRPRNTPKVVRRAAPRRFGRGAQLEPRVLLSGTHISALVSYTYTPMQVRVAYGLNQLMVSNPQGGSTTLDGRGQTIAVIEAYSDPTIASDLSLFDQSLGLPDPPLRVATPQGTPGRDPTGAWSYETALDVEWSHAIAPAASILLVEAASSSVSNLVGAVDYARQQAGVVAITMSWGTAEWAGETALDSIFTTPTGHLGGSSGLPGASNLPGGVTFVAASGDHGASQGPTWPAVSPNVVGVGGTSLSLADSSGQYGSESAWSGSGGGVSWYEKAPGYQQIVQNTGYRTSPDVAMVADPNTGVYVVNAGHWYSMGGTSAAAPMMAGVVALANQARAVNGLGSLDGPTQTLPALYQAANNAYSTNYHDVTSGNNGYQAGPGYDMVTGLGSPRGAALVPTLAGGATAPTTQGGSTAIAPSAQTQKKLPPRAAAVSFVIGETPDGQPITITVPVATLNNAVLELSAMSARPPATLNTNNPTGPVENTAPVVQPPQITTGPTSLLTAALRQFNADLNIHAPSVVPLPAAQGGTDNTPEQVPPAKPDGSSGVAPTAGPHRAAPVQDGGKAKQDSSNTGKILTPKAQSTSPAQTSNGQSITGPVSPLAAVFLVVGAYQMAPEAVPEREERPGL